MRSKSEAGLLALGTTSGQVIADPSKASIMTATFNGNATLLVKLADPGTVMRILFQQDAAAGRTLTLDGASEASAVFGGATTIALNVGANAVTIYDLVWHASDKVCITKQ